MPARRRGGHETAGVTKPRVRPLLRHEPAPAPRSIT